MCQYDEVLKDAWCVDGGLRRLEEAAKEGLLHLCEELQTVAYSTTQSGLASLKRRQIWLGQLHL